MVFGFELAPIRPQQSGFVNWRIDGLGRGSKGPALLEMKISEDDAGKAAGHLAVFPLRRRIRWPATPRSRIAKTDGSGTSAVRDVLLAMAMLK